MVNRRNINRVHRNLFRFRANSRNFKSALTLLTQLYKIFAPFRFYATFASLINEQATTMTATKKASKHQTTPKLLEFDRPNNSRLWQALF